MKNHQKQSFNLKNSSDNFPLSRYKTFEQKSPKESKQIFISFISFFSSRKKRKTNISPDIFPSFYVEEKRELLLFSFHRCWCVNLCMTLAHTCLNWKSKRKSEEKKVSCVLGKWKFSFISFCCVPSAFSVHSPVRR